MLRRGRSINPTPSMTPLREGIYRPLNIVWDYANIAPASVTPIEALAMSQIGLVGFARAQLLRCLGLRLY